VSVETDHEEEREMVGVPKCLKALNANLVVGSRIHQNHDEEHHVSGNTSWLLIMNVERVSGTEF
jgi:hypothetical protein